VDTAIAVALVTGGLGTIGAIGNIAERVSSARTAARGEGSRLDLDRRAAIDAKVDKYIERIEKDAEREREHHENEIKTLRDEYESKLAALGRDHEELQRLYREALERLESLEMNNRKGLSE
jgi:hypothetical protein